MTDEDTPKAPPSMLSSALWYAGQGLRVFPLSPGSKIPFKGSSGCLDATSNEELIRDWWEQDPDSNIGIATGHLVDVVDIDGFPGQQSRAQHWESTFERVDLDSVAKVLTPRPGGMHLYLPAQPEHRNGANIATGIDMRAKNGYVVAPPSRTEVGTYRFLGTPNFGGLT
jgi:hypothetical protein